VAFFIQNDVSSSTLFQDQVPAIRRSIFDYTDREVTIGLPDQRSSFGDDTFVEAVSQNTSSLATSNDKTTKTAFTAPPRITVEDSARPFITDLVSDTLYALLNQAIFAARIRFIPIDHIDVKGYIDRDEDTKLIIANILVNTDSETAFKFWTYLGSFVQDYIDTRLPSRLRDLAVERISFEVEALEDAHRIRS
jgi:hypothetical protein